MRNYKKFVHGWLVAVGMTTFMTSCSPMPYVLHYIYANTENYSRLSDEVKGEPVKLRADVAALGDISYAPRILAYERYTTVISNRAPHPAWPTPIHYEVTLPANPLMAVTNGNCEVVLRYPDSQTVWIYDYDPTVFSSSEEARQGVLPGVPEGMYEPDSEELLKILSMNPIYGRPREGRDSIEPGYRTISGRKVFVTAEIRFIFGDGPDSLAYDKRIWTCGKYYGEPPAKYRNQVEIIPEKEKLPSHIGSFGEFRATRGCVPPIRMPEIRKGRKSFIYVKDGLFVLAYNLRPRDYPLFKAMVANTFRVRASSVKTGQDEQAAPSRKRRAIRNWESQPHL